MFTLTVNSQAEHALSRANRAAKSANPEFALPLFDNAFEVLHAHNPNLNDPGFRVHSARLARDAAFARARIGIKDGEPDLVHGAYRATQTAYDTLTNVAIEVPRTTGRLAPKEIEDYLFSERGVTITHQGRLAVVYALLDPSDDKQSLRETSEKQEPMTQNECFALAQEHFTVADLLLAQGSNAYYRASNLANQARLQRILGNGRAAKTSMKRAAQIARTAASIDRPNFISAARTTARLAIHSRTPNAAHESVLTHP